MVRVLLEGAEEVVLETLWIRGCVTDFRSF